MPTPAAVERRRPDRRVFVILLLRRLTVYALAASFLIWAAPRLLVEFGLVGPSPDETIAAAERALEAARTYGATPDMPSFVAAQRELERARTLAGQNRGRDARHASKHAQDLAVEAQRQGLVRRDEARQHATIVYNDLDRQINDLEKLYSKVTPGLEKTEVGELLTLMKVTRVSTGAVFLAYEQEDFNSVLEGEAKARGAIAQMRSRLEAARR
ncbi:MAG TPA: hypothetical protein VGN09_04570 [Vicinamibacteria bacterium]